MKSLCNIKKFRLKPCKDYVCNIKKESIWYANCKIWFSASICFYIFALIGVVVLNNFSKKPHYSLSWVFIGKLRLFSNNCTLSSPYLHVKWFMNNPLLSSPSLHLRNENSSSAFHDGFHPPPLGWIPSLLHQASIHSYPLWDLVLFLPPLPFGSLIFLQGTTLFPILSPCSSLEFHLQA